MSPVVLSLRSSLSRLLYQPVSSVLSLHILCHRVFRLFSHVFFTIVSSGFSLLSLYHRISSLSPFPFLYHCVSSSFLSRLFIIMSSVYPSYIFIIVCLPSTLLTSSVSPRFFSLSLLHPPHHLVSPFFPSFFHLHQFLNLSELIMQLDHANVSELCLLRRYHASTLVLLI